MRSHLRARRLPDDDGRCGWWAALPQPSPSRRVFGEERADSAIIGAGFTGLAIARRLAEAMTDRRVAVVEAQRVGFGTSGRNSGFVGDISHRNPNLDADGTHRSQRVARFGCDQLRELVREHDIDCDWSEVGRLHVALEDHALRNLDHLLRLLREFDEPHEPMDSSAIASVLGTRFYRAGVRIPGTVLLQPSALIRGLAASLPDNVDLFEESPVRAIDRGPRFRLEAGRGTVVADRIFLATNGFTPGLGLLARRVFPLMTYASLTRPLTSEERAELGGDPEWGLVSEDRMGSSIRRTPDQRILIRNSVRYAPSLRNRASRYRAIQAIHRRSLRARFPALDAVDLEHTWAGVLGMTLNQGQLFGQLADELYASVGYNGTGVAMGTGSGALLADLALGAHSSLVSDALQLQKPSWLPHEPLLGWGVRGYTAYLQRRAGAER